MKMCKVYSDATYICTKCSFKMLNGTKITVTLQHRLILNLFSFRSRWWLFNLPMTRKKMKPMMRSGEPLTATPHAKLMRGDNSRVAQNRKLSSVQGRRGGIIVGPGNFPSLWYCSCKASWHTHKTIMFPNKVLRLLFIIKNPTELLITYVTFAKYIANNRTTTLKKFWLHE